jgi:hypothetical protein
MSVSSSPPRPQPRVLCSVPWPAGRPAGAEEAVTNTVPSELIPSAYLLPRGLFTASRSWCE